MKSQTGSHLIDIMKMVRREAHQEFVHVHLALLQVDALDGHLLLARYAVGCLDHGRRPAP